MRVHPLLAGAALALTACSGTPTAAPSSPPPVPLESPTPTASPSPSPSPSAELAVGATQTTGDSEVSATIKVMRVRAPFPSRYPPDRKGYEYVGVEVKTCVTKNTSDEQVTLSWGPWSLALPDDTIVQSPSSWNSDGFSVPLYPNDEHVLRAGRCVRGWIPFEVRKGAKPALVSYQPSWTGALDWSVR